MSANDIIVLNIKRFTVFHVDSEGGRPYKKIRCKSLKEALKKTIELQDKISPEYGVFISEE